MNTGSVVGDPTLPEREQVADARSPQSVDRRSTGATTARDDATTGRRRRWWEWTREPPEQPREIPIVTFSDLVRAHRAWEHELYEHERHGGQPDRVLEDEFHEKWRLFEARYGAIDA